MIDARRLERQATLTTIVITPSKKTVRMLQGDAPPQVKTTFGWSYHVGPHHIPQDIMPFTRREDREAFVDAAHHALAPRCTRDEAASIAAMIVFEQRGPAANGELARLWREEQPCYGCLSPQQWGYISAVDLVPALTRLTHEGTPATLAPVGPNRQT
jgi:hypothetical protein